MDPKWFFGTMEQDLVLPAVTIPRPQSRVESPVDALVDVAFFFLEEETSPRESLRHEGQNQSASSASSSFAAASAAS